MNKKYIFLEMNILFLNNYYFLLKGIYFILCYNNKFKKKLKIKIKE